MHRLRSDVGVRLDLDDEDGTVYQGRIDALIVQGDSQANLWVVLVEAKRTLFNFSLNRRCNELWDILRILNRLKGGAIE
jgi:hypothetical protein